MLIVFVPAPISSNDHAQKYGWQGPAVAATVACTGSNADGSQLILSETNQTGFMGVRLHHGRYRAACTTSPCRNKTIGKADRPEEAAHLYLQHWEEAHLKTLHTVGTSAAAAVVRADLEDQQQEQALILAQAPASPGPPPGPSASALTLELEKLKNELKKQVHFARTLMYSR